MRCNFQSCIFATILTALCACLPATSAKADVTVYTDAAAYASAITSNGYTSTVLDFESVSAGSTFVSGSTIGHIDFDGFVAPNLLVTDDFATTSGANYLGMSDPGFANQFIGGFDFDMQFSDSHAIGMFVISSEIPNFSIFDNDIVIDVPGVGTAPIDIDDLQGTVGGDNVFFIGLIDTMSTFTTARVRYDPTAISAIVFNIDDISTASGFLLGDVNQDGFVNLLDVEPFVALISTGTFQIEADVNQDGFVNLLDVEPFIDLLTG